MLYGIIVSVVLLVISIGFGLMTRISLRDQIALSSMLIGSSMITATGFMVSEAIGMLALSVVFFIVAFLFGYERG